MRTAASDVFRHNGTLYIAHAQGVQYLKPQPGTTPMFVNVAGGLRIGEPAADLAVGKTGSPASQFFTGTVTYTVTDTGGFSFTSAPVALSGGKATFGVKIGRARFKGPVQINPQSPYPTQIKISPMTIAADHQSARWRSRRMPVPTSAMRTPFSPW